jgi:class 3 adenylate cyclase/predicted ATPase
MSIDIADWLHRLGLEQYTQAFADNDVDSDVLCELTADDLIGLGITSIGHRRKLLSAIAALRNHASQLAIQAEPATAPIPGVAERRQLSVMFCDLVGSTALAARLDPEDLREVIGAYHRAITETMAPYEGFIAKYLGDGALVYFGYPRAHEDDAERAVRAALKLLTAINQINQTDCKLQMRIGIATGVAVVGDLVGTGAAREETVIGDTPNLAFRLQTLASPNSVLIDDGTRRLVGTLFEVTDLGPQALRGFSEMQRAWHVVGESPVESRFKALRSGSTPFVGRTEELDLLLRRWAEVKVGEGHVLLLSGEPGIGKSRLTAALQERISSEPHTHISYFCSPHHQDSALHPVIAQLERAAGFARDDTSATKFDKLATLLAPDADDDDVSLIAELLSLAPGECYRPLDLSPQRKKDLTFAALRHQLEALVQRQPVLMIFEDLHWIDPTSRELLDRIIERIEQLSLLVIATYRPEFEPSWIGRPQVSSLTLNRLGRSDGGKLVRRLAGDAVVLSADVIEAIVERSDGVPLFVEELTKAMVEAGAEHRCNAPSSFPTRSLPVPATLQASLMARIDRLGATAKLVAQIASAIGREFSYELLATVAQLAVPPLEDALRRLVTAGLVFQRGAPPGSIYLFKHAMIEDTAYSTLLRRPRQALHARIVGALEDRFPTVTETQPEILAHHATEAGLLEKAIAYWHSAAQQSLAKSAVIEAVGQLRRGLLLIADLPETHQRDQRELDFQIALGGALQKAKGYAHPDAIEAFERAHALIARIGGEGTPLGFSVLWGLCIANYIGGNLLAAVQQATEYLSIAQSQMDVGPRIIGHRLLGTALLNRGDFAAADAHLERAASLCTLEEHQRLASRFGQDDAISAICYWAWALWHRGYPDRSRNAVGQARRYAAETARPYTISCALFFSAHTAVVSRRAIEAEQFITQLRALVREHGFATWSGYVKVFQGWAVAQRVKSVAAVELIREGLAANNGVLRRSRPAYHGLLAEALVLVGDIQQGLAVVAEASKVAEASGVRGADAELHRLRGDLLRRLPNPDMTEIEACFRKAIAIAREQGTRGFELRSATSLAALLGDQGRRAEARDALAPIYGWFTEGFDTPDLTDAAALLAELS